MVKNIIESVTTKIYSFIFIINYFFTTFLKNNINNIVEWCSISFKVCVIEYYYKLHIWKFNFL